MRLTLHFDVNRERITASDLKQLRWWQRNLVTATGSISYLQLAAAEDSVTAHFLNGSVWPWPLPESPRMEASGRDRAVVRRRVGSAAYDIVETARDICWVLDAYEGIPGRWDAAVHFCILQAQSCTRSSLNEELIIETRTRFHPVVEEHSLALMRRVIEVWVCGVEVSMPPEHPDSGFRHRVGVALDFREANGWIRSGVEGGVALAASRLDPALAPQDPDRLPPCDVPDPEMFVRMIASELGADDDLPETDAQLKAEDW